MRYGGFAPVSVKLYYRSSFQLFSTAVQTQTIDLGERMLIKLGTQSSTPPAASA